MTVRLIAICLLITFAVSACLHGEAPSNLKARRACNVADAVVCDAIVQQVTRHASPIAGPPVTVVVPFKPDRLFQRGGDFSVFVSFATLDPTEPVSTWTATKVQSASGTVDTDWIVAKWNGSLPSHLVAALRVAQSEAVR